MKILLFFLLIICTGCTNKPVDEVNKLFYNYNNLTSEVLIDIDKVFETEDMSEEDKIRFKEIIKNQYKNLKYNIISETINNKNAIVTVLIEVYDLYDAILLTNEYISNNKPLYYKNGKIDKDLYIKLKLDNMEKTTKRIEYMIDFKLSKIDNKWYLNDLDEKIRSQIHGLYEI